MYSETEQRINQRGKVISTKAHLKLASQKDPELKREYFSGVDCIVRLERWEC